MRLKNQSIIRRKRLRFLPQAPSKVHESLGKSKLCGLDDELHAPSAHELVDVRAIGEAHHAGERLRVAEEDRVEALAAELEDELGVGVLHEALAHDAELVRKDGRVEALAPDLAVDRLHEALGDLVGARPPSV